MMKHLTAVLLAVGLAGSVLASPDKPDSARPAALVGKWASMTAEANALHGTITLDADGKAELAPAGFEPMQGSWLAADGKLRLDMPPHGTVAIPYVLSGGGELTLTYENGNSQTFRKETDK